MADFCTLALTIMVCSLILVVIFQAFGIPKMLERIATELERIADALEKEGSKNE